MVEYTDLVQICLPTHNGESHLAEALDSLLGQTHGNIEVVIMDNASTDGTARIAQSYANKDCRIRYYRSEEFVSASDNWNRAFEKIDQRRSRFLIWAGDDDIWSADYIERLLFPLMNDQSCVLSYSNYRQIDLLGSVVNKCRFGKVSWRANSTFDAYRWLMREGGGHCAICGIIRLDALTWSPLFVDTCFGGDLYFLLRLAAKGRFSYLGDELFSKRLGGISSTGEDASVIKDVQNTWNIGEREWQLIDELSVPFQTKLYIFWRLKVAAKLFFPSKGLEPYLWPWFAFHMVRVNQRGLGLRSTVRRIARRLILPGV
jgi:glycosyltransferase involved in cell wall biosynthesis